MLTYTYISKGKFGLVEKPKPTIQQRGTYELFENKRDGVIKVVEEC